MRWEFVIALAVTIPIILLPVIFAWFLNIGGVARLVHRRANKEIRQVAQAK